MRPDYDSAYVDNDICIRELDGDLTFGHSVGAVVMPEQDEEFVVGSDAIMSSWGALQYGDSGHPLVLQWVTVPTVS